MTIYDHLCLPLTWPPLATFGHQRKSLTTSDNLWQTPKTLSYLLAFRGFSMTPSQISTLIHILTEGLFTDLVGQKSENLENSLIYSGRNHLSPFLTISKQLWHYLTASENMWPSYVNLWQSPTSSGYIWQPLTISDNVWNIWQPLTINVYRYC